MEKRVWVNDTCVVGDGVLAGAGYSAALYWGFPTETDDRNMIQTGPAVSMLGTTGGAGTTVAGTYFGGGRTVTTPNSTANAPVLAFQVRGWSTSAGSSYEAALASGNGQIGKGPMFTLKTKSPDTTETNPNVWQASGYTGFALGPVGMGGCNVIPEPSSTALTLLGVSTLFLVRNRNRK